MKVVEIFDSFQGEGRWVGWPMTFVRLAGCPVGCPFCDTDYEGGVELDFKDIPLTNKIVCITGGEPLMYKELPLLIDWLRGCERTVHVETSGCFTLPHLYYSMVWLTVSPKGKWCGAKMDFIPSVLYFAAEVKWIVPETPPDIIDMYSDWCVCNYIQPCNQKGEVDRLSLGYAEEAARKRGWPLSVQTHKMLGWR
jgi:organic radical activating enzyme